VPQVVDEVGKRVPIIAVGGIADGRGRAAALLFGSQEINTDTRILASTEIAVSQDLKNKVISGTSEDAIKAGFIIIVFPTAGKDTYKEDSPRTLHTPLIERWNGRSRNEVEHQAE
jgi:nitronate monooxygenase